MSFILVDGWAKLMGTQFQEIADWLLATAAEHTDLRTVTDKIVTRLCAAGMPIHRINLGVLALHPEMAGYAVLWDESMSEAVEFPIRREDMLQSTYLDSPIRLLVESREAVDYDLEAPSDTLEFPVLREFKNAGYTRYVGFPLAYGEGHVAVFTCCTKRPGGFTAEHTAGIQKIFPVLRLILSVVETRRLAKTVLRTYLGRDTGERVLAGEILRGQGERIEAALWFCDLRGYTAMTAKIGSFAMIDVMNQYFDCMAEAVWAEGGEILKFMGDAMLVVFRVGDDFPSQVASCSAVRAAQSALGNLAKLSEQRVNEGQLPLRAGVAIHLGSVVYGNIGASSRLDFTVMGHSVNLVARIQNLTGETGEGILFSREIADHLDEPAVSIGRHELKGVPELVEVFKVH
jgi:adenylate cyclase